MTANAQPTMVARRFLHLCGRVALAVTSLLLASGLYTRAQAQLTVTLQSETDLTVDHNAPCTDGPRASYVQYRFQNSGATSLTGIGVTLGGFASGIALSGGQAQVLYLPTMAPGATADLYWFITYPCTVGASATLTATARNMSNVTVGTGSALLTVVGILSANAGGSMVSQNLVGHVIGGITYIDVVYSFPGAEVGSRYIMEVSGYASFRADCFQLVETLIAASNIPTIQVGDRNKTKYTATSKTTGNGYSVTVRYSFRIQCLGTSSTTSPYAVAGKAAQIKYIGQFTNAGDPGSGGGGGGGIPIPPPENPFTITKAGAPDSLGAGGIATFTIVVSNVSTQAAAFDSLVDTLRAGLSFSAMHPSSGITAGNSAALPPTGATGRITFRSIPGTGYAVPAGGTLTLVYTVTVQDAEGWYRNTATIYAGVSAAGTATDSVRVRFPVVVVVTPDGVTPAVRRVPGGGWAQDFLVTNVTRRGGEGFDLLFSIDQSPAVVVQRDSITGPGIVAVNGDSARVLAWPAATARTYTLHYRMTPGDTGVQNVLKLQARSVTYPSIRDTGHVQVRRGAPRLTLLKAANVAVLKPGEDVEYTIAFTNAGTFDARGTVVTDSIPHELSYKLASHTVTLPGGLTGTMQYSSDGGSTWSYAPVSAGCGAPAGYDRCVTHIRLSVAGDLAPNSAGSGSLRFSARLR